MYKCQVPQNLDQSLVSTNNKKKCKAIEIEITPNTHPKKSNLKDYKTDMFNMIKCILKKLNFEKKICYMKTLRYVVK